NVRRTMGVPVGKFLLARARNKVGRRLRVLACGGAALDPEMMSKLEGLGWNVVIGYGLTETSPILTLNQSGARKCDSAGKVIPGVELKIAPLENETPSRKKAKSQGEDDRVGEVLARSDGVFSGYRNLEQEKADSFTLDGWFRTGDLGV